MPGVKGRGGPPPKRSDQRRRKAAPAGGEAQRADGAAVVPVPEANDGWHPMAIRWFESLGKSGQSQFYEPSDWATAELVAESLSRELESDGPVKAAMLSALMSAMSVLLVTEGDRRRARLELTRPQAVTGEEADVSELDDYRRRLRSS